MYPQDILYYVGFGLIALSVVLAVLSVVVFITRDVRSALRFLAGKEGAGAGPLGADAGRTEARKPAAIHRTHVVTKQTCESLAQAEAAARPGAAAVAASELMEEGPHDPTQDVLETVVADASQDAMATVVGDMRQDTLATVVAADDMPHTNADNSYGVPIRAHVVCNNRKENLDSNEVDQGLGFQATKSILVLNAEVDLYVV